MPKHPQSDMEAAADLTKAVTRVTPRVLDSFDRTADRIFSLGPWLANTQFSHVIDNSFGLLNDHIVSLRKRNITATLEETKALLAGRGVEDYQEPPPKITEDILVGAAEATDESVRTIWAKLLANALDPLTGGLVRPEILEVVKTLHPMDVKILDHVIKYENQIARSSLVSSIVEIYKLNIIDVDYSISKLTHNVIFIVQNDSGQTPRLTALGQLIKRAIT